MQPDEKIALRNCDTEPVHVPGRIQSFGAVIGFDFETGNISHVSDNLDAMFSDLPVEKLGKNFEDVITERKIVHAVRGAMGLPSIATARDRLGVFNLSGQPAEFSVYVVDGMVVVEIEPVETIAPPSSSIATVRSMLSVLQTGQGLDPLLNSSVMSLRHTTGFDRVMAYRFLENGDGEIVAEAKGPGIEPFLGLRYPAFDIPLQVRQIMLRAPFRFIDDIRDPHAAIVREHDANRIDLTLSHLRGVSPIYVEYLENMGVRATMNVSIIVREKLWGMFAFHHYRKRKLDPDRRTICELFGQLVSMQIYQELEQEAFERRRRTQSIMATLRTTGSSIKEIFPQLAKEFCEILRADGIAMIDIEGVSSSGEVPGDEAIRAISQLSGDPMFSLDNLSSTTAAHLVQSDKTAGALVVHLDDDQSVLFFRNEIIHEVRWAGSPEKKIDVGPNGPRLTPRGSFAEYKESVAGICHPWKEGDMSAANEICGELFRLAYPASKVLNQDWEKHKRYQDLLIAELNHRVRNTLALTRSIVKQTESSESSLEKYVGALERRIAALSKAHDLIGTSGLQWARIEDLVGTELKPYDYAEIELTTGGPSIAIRADVAPIVSLVIHELTSNAVKHGALSTNGKSLDVQWGHDAGGVKICWHEVLTTEVVKPDNQGFGLALIERAVPYECNGKSAISFEGNELKIEFWLPAESVQHLPESDLKKPHTSSRQELDAHRKLGFDTVMIVEDNMVLAMEMEKILVDLGAKETGSFSNPESAIESLSNVDFDAGVLDINLGGSDSFELASLMKKKGIPFVFVSGYDSKYEVPPELTGIARLSKPVDKAELILALESARQELE